MSNWQMHLSNTGTGRYLDTPTFLSTSWDLERDLEHEARFRMTYRINGKKVTHTFDMGSRWEKRFGPIGDAAK